MEKQNIVAKANNIIYEEKALFTDPAFLDMFTFPLKYGDSKITLHSQDSIVLSENTAAKYFGEEDPVGQILS